MDATFFKVLVTRKNVNCAIEGGKDEIVRESKAGVIMAFDEPMCSTQDICPS